MRVSKRTERLIREAAVLGFVQGAMWGAANPRYMIDDPNNERYPKDSMVVRDVLRAAESHREYYPTLSKVEPQTPFLLPPQWLVDFQRAETDYLRGLMSR